MFDAPEPSRTLKSLFGALVFVLGAQSIRFLFGSITWYLRDTVGIGVIHLIPIAIAPFLVAMLFPVLSRWLTVRGAVWIGAWALVIARTVNQVSASPSVDLWSAAVGVAAFVGLLPLLLSMGRTAIVGGLLLGVAIDSAIKGLNLSLDLAMQTGIPSLVGTLVICIALVYVLWACPAIEREGVPLSSSVRLVGLAPILFFEMLVLQNQGWTAEAAMIGGHQAQLRIALLNVLALIVLPRLERSRLASLVALVIVAAALVMAEASPLLFNVMTVLAIPAAGLVWSMMVADPMEMGLGFGAAFLTVGMVCFVFFGLAYYLPLDLDLGLTQPAVRLAVAGFLGMVGIAALLSAPSTRPGATGQLWAFSAMAALLPLVGLLSAGLGGGAGPGLLPPLRAMTYNIHSGYDTRGRFDLETLARVIEDSEATVVALQEVPRGTLISGVTDVVTVLQERLGFAHAAFFGTTDPAFGNAILSRFPISEIDRVYLPQVGTPLRRGYLGARLMYGDVEILVVSTHLQHVNDPAVHDDDPESDLYPVHHEQVEAIVEAWGGVQPAILMGDFNARPGWRQIDELLDSGWVDSWAEAGVGEGLTANSADPRYRIDYVFHTPDLEVLDVGVIPTQASDHYPVAADLALQGD